MGEVSHHHGLMEKYRPDIDGLRALAILPVLLFHAGIPGFSGGFVGVDVFFVISGYLITGIIARELEAGNFSIARFYERRIRRIAPVLLVVLLFVLLVSCFLLLPSEFRVLGKETVGALLFVANIVFWRESGYFAADAEAKPLLHTWSLGVEEQFYIFAPLALWLIWRFAPRFKLPLVAAGFVVSLTACIVLTPRFPSASFYLLPTRAWELLAGSLLVLRAISRQSSVVSRQPALLEICAMTGLALLFFAVFFYDEGTLFPGHAAIAPVAGSALLIASGARTWMGRMLASKPLVFIGLISYSLYLWHWPLIVFFRDLGWLETLAGRVAVVAASVVFAWLSWRFIETPTRNRTIFPVPHLLGSSALVAVVVLATSIVFHKLDGWPSRLSPQVVAYDAARDDISSSRNRCHFDSGLPDPAKSCVLGGSQAHVAVWGDSHGVELAQAIGEAGIPVVEISYSGCAPATVNPLKAENSICQKHNRQVADYFSSISDIDTIVLVAFYNARDALTNAVADQAEMLVAAGKRVIVVGPTPRLEGNLDVPTYLARGGSRYFTYKDNTGGILTNRLAGKATLFLPEQIYCMNGTCDLLPQGSPLLFDSHHPSMHTARITANKLIPILHSSPDTGIVK